MDLAADFEAISPSEVTQAQAEVVLVGCGAPNRGMGWYHAVQMLEGRWVLKEVETDGWFRVLYDLVWEVCWLWLIDCWIISAALSYYFYDVGALFAISA